MSQKSSPKSCPAGILAVLVQHGFLDEDTPYPYPQPQPHRARCGRWGKDPRERNITKRGTRWAVRIAGGRNGYKLYVGMYGTLGEAMKARDAAEA